MTQQNIVNSLNVLMANTYALYLKTQNYHWNVTGIYFLNLHTLFEEQYKQLAEGVDEIAERITFLGAKAPATFEEYIKLASIKSGNSSYNYENMLKDLEKDQLNIIDSLKKLIVHAQECDDEGTIDLAVARIKAHEKAYWMLSSHLKK